jgi:hypothetical protein
MRREGGFRLERGKKAEFGEWRDKGDETEGRALDESRKSEFGEGRDEKKLGKLSFCRSSDSKIAKVVK